MTIAPIAFQSSEGHYAFEGVAKLINAFAEKRGKDAKAPLSVVPSDGIIEASDEAPGFCRGMIYMEDLDKLYSFHPSSCYRTTFDGTTFTTTRIGTVPGVDIVQLSRNQKSDPEVTIKTDSGVMVLASDALVYQTDVDFPDDVVTADYVSGFTVVGRENRIFNFSGIDTSLIWDALDFATFQQRAGKLVRVQENAGELLGFCSSWMEFWRNTGGADNPFTPIAFRSRGLKARNAVSRCAGTLIFPGDDGVVYELNNYDPKRISTHTVERLISDDSMAEEMLGFSWSKDGHSFANPFPRSLSETRFPANLAISTGIPTLNLATRWSGAWTAHRSMCFRMVRSLMRSTWTLRQATARCRGRAVTRSSCWKSVRTVAIRSSSIVSCLLASRASMQQE